MCVRVCVCALAHECVCVPPPLSVPGIIGSLQAMEAIKLLSGVGSSLGGRLLLYDALAPSFTTVGAITAGH